MKYLCILIVLFQLPYLFAQSSAGNTLSLDGDDDYAWVPDNPALNPQNQITLEAWVYSDNYDRSQWQEFIMKGGNDSNTPRQYYIRPYNNHGRLQFLLHDTDNNDNSASSDNPLNNGSWDHVAGTYDGQFMRVYINGVLHDEDDEGQFIIQTSDGMLAFGRLGDIDAEYFHGKIDEVRIWNIARTQLQLISTMNDTLSQAYYLTADSGLIGYWRFDALEDLGVNGDGEDDVRDFSIYGNHADLENGALLVPSQALVSAESIDNIIPENFYLSQNYPNPFNPATIIRYSVPQRSNVTLKVYNVLGNEIVILVSEEKDRGVYIVRFDASNLASGMYLYRLQAGSFVETKKMLFLK